jgi:hypothetical protein
MFAELNISPVKRRYRQLSITDRKLTYQDHQSGSDHAICSTYWLFPEGASKRSASNAYPIDRMPLQAESAKRRCR